MDELDNASVDQLIATEREFKKQDSGRIAQMEWPKQESLDSLPVDQLKDLALKFRQHDEEQLAPFREEAARGQGAYTVSESPGAYIGRQFVSTLRSIPMNFAYGVAKDRLSRGEAEDSDLRAIAAYEHEQGIDQRQPEWAKTAGSVAGAAGSVGAVGLPILGPAVFAAQALTGASAQAGQAIWNPEVLLKGGATAAAQIGVLKALGPISSKLFPEAQGVLAQAGSHAVTGTAGLAVADYGTKLAGLSEHGGPIQDIIDGHYGDAARNLLSNAIMTGGLGAVEGLRAGYSRKASVEKAVEGVQSVAEQVTANPERRADAARRKAVSEMSPEEMQKELLTSKTVSLPNKRAFEEAGPAKAVGMSDADGLKAFNDKFGYEAGNSLLRAKAEALKAAGLEAFHDKGDEFLYRGGSPEEIRAKLERAREILKDSTIEVTLADGSVKRYKGADFSYGTGADLTSAESGLKAHKSEREARGERARGELRGIAELGPETSQVDQGRAGPGRNGTPPEQGTAVAPTLKTEPSEPRPELANASQPAPEAPGDVNLKKQFLEAMGLNPKRMSDAKVASEAKRLRFDEFQARQEPQRPEASPEGPSIAESLAVRSPGGLEKAPAENLADSVEDAVGRMVEDMASGPYFAHEQSRIMSAWRTVRAAAAKSGGTFAEYSDPQWVKEHSPRDAGQVNRAIATIVGYHRTLNQRYGGWEPPEGWDPTTGTNGPRARGLAEEAGVQNRAPALPAAPSDPLADAYSRKGIIKRDQRLHQAAIAGEDSLRSAARKEGLSPEGVRKAIKRVDERLGSEFSVEAMRAKEKSAREELRRGGVEAPGEEPAAKPRKPTEEEKRSKKLDDLGDLIMRQAEQGKLSPEAMARHKAEADRIAGVEALKEAKQAGIPPEHVEAMADDILAEHKESIRDWQSLYRDAYDALKEFGVTPQKLHGVLTRAAKDPASIKGMDEVAQDLAEKYPSFFRLKTEHASDTLASLLLKGKPQSMTVAEAREQAADRLAKKGVDGATKAALRSGDTQADVAESVRRGKEASDAELSAGQAEEGAGEGGEFAFGANEPDPARVAALMKQGFSRSAAEERAALEAAKQQHPQQAMGAAALGELTGSAEQRTNPRLTALAHAQGDIERENLDLGPAPARGGYSFERVNAAAEAAIRADPQLPGKILAELERKLRPLDAVETVVVEHEKVRLNNHLDRLNSVLEMGDAIDQAEYRREQLETLGQIERLMDLTDRAGSEAGGAFVLRQQLMAEDYSAVGLTRRAAAAKGSPLTTEERAQFEKMAQEISRLQTKLAAFERPDSPNAADVRVELNRAKRTAKQTIGDLKLANLPIPQRVFRGGMEMLDASRALMTSMDFSAVLRQGGFLAFGHPVVMAKALPEMFRATLSEHRAALARDAIEQRPNSLLYKRAGLYLADPHAPLSAQEESFAGRWVKKIPGIAASERAYTTVLNRVRADVFDAMISSEAAKGQVSDKAAAALANFVNIASGRGNLGGLERAGTTLARIFFSPRFVASRFQLVAGSPLWGGTMSTRQAITKEYARTAIGLGVFYGAAAMAAQALGAKKDEFSLSFDPRSADFGKIKMGNTRIDPLFGLAQTIVLEGRTATGQTKSTKTGEVTSLSNPKFGQSSFTDVLSRFIRSKLAPIPGALIDLREGKNVVGQPATLGSKAQELVTPIAVEDVVKAIKEQGVPTGLATGLAAIFGMGVQVYEKKQAAVPVGRR